MPASDVTWPDGLVQAEVLRHLGAIDHLSARRAGGGEPVTLVASHGPATPETVELLAEVARLHPLVEHPRIPRVLAHDRTREGVAYVVLDFPAVADFEQLIAAAVSRLHEFPYEAGAAFAFSLLDVLRACHRTIDPRHGRPVCMGTFSSANVLVAADGRHAFVGLGHPWDTLARARLLPQMPAPAADIAAVLGTEPTPAGDVYGAALFLRSLPHGRLPPAVTRVLSGEPREEDGPLAAAIAEFAAIGFAVQPSGRSLDALEGSARRLFAALGIPPDERALAGAFAELHALRSRDRERHLLLVGPEAAWFRPPGEPTVSLGRRRVLRRLLAALVEARLQTPGQPLGPADLLAAAWPGEKMSAEAGTNRLHVAIAHLRRLGLRGLLRSEADGYLLDTSVEVERRDGAPEVG